ncbi:MAG: sulfatase [Armatimonadetes bacterium]|nr:sulfatase [Armatimonadota bacterium]
MNIVLISCDSLRADHLGLYGYHRPTSPNLDSWAADAVVADNFICPGVPTTPAHTSVFTGQTTLTHGLVSHRGGMEPRAGYPWIPSIFHDNGYLTGAVDNIKRLLPWYTLGFEDYIDPSRRFRHVWSIPMSVLNQRTIPWVREHAGAEPFFLFVHTWDTHTPYLPPLDVRHTFYPGDPCDPNVDTMRPFRRQYFHERSGEWLAELERDLGRGPITDTGYLEAIYDACILGLDQHLTNLLHVLEETGVADDTLVMIFGDHGEMMGSHDIYFDHHGLYEGNIRPPLLCRWPNGGVSGGRRVRQLCQHQDLGATALSAAGFEAPAGVEGLDLLPLLRGEAVSDWRGHVLSQECTWQAAWAMRTDTHKLIASRGPSLHNRPARELYNVVTDPGETDNLYLSEWELAAELENKMEGEIAARLAALGLADDPVCHENISLGRRWFEWLENRSGRRT